MRVNGKFGDPHRSSGLIYVDGGFFRLFYTLMTAFAITHKLLACVTLGFCNSVRKNVNACKTVGMYLLISRL
jgi:hypothetical protein